jgi:putative ABC transport system substrate-binding protein
LVPGQNVQIDYRWAADAAERLPTLAAELVEARVDVIVTDGSEDAIRIAMSATSSIPIVMVAGPDPVRAGLIASLARPGGNVTGLATLTPELTTKRLELLRECVPQARRVAALWAPSQSGATTISDVEDAVAKLGIDLQSVPVQGPDDLENAFDAILRGRADALAILGSILLFRQRTRIVQFAMQHTLRGVYTRREYAQAGGLISYGPNFLHNPRRAAYYVDRILKGAKPADLPVEQPREFECVINLKTAQALNLTIPQHVLLQATEAIE